MQVNNIAGRGQIFVWAALPAALSLIQAAGSLREYVFGPSASDLDNFTALDELSLLSLATVPISILFYFLCKYKAYFLIKLGIFLLLLNTYWVAFMNKPVFQDRVAAWSTFTPAESWSHILLISTPSLVLSDFILALFLISFRRRRPSYLDKPLY